MRMMKKENQKGFTLIETILAAIILSGSVLALGAISTRSLTATKLNREYETAAALAEKQLTIIDYTGIEDFIELGRMEGVFEQAQPGYYWQASAVVMDIDNLYHVNMTVSWVHRKRTYSVSVDTRLNGKGMLIEIEK